MKIHYNWGYSDEISKGLMREGSLSARIYFLLLKKPLTQTDISKKVYNGRVMLANIRKNLEYLEKENFVERIGRKAGKGNNFNKIYYRANLNPFLDFVNSRVDLRKRTSKSRYKQSLTQDEEKFLINFFNSEWFKRFYSQEFLDIDLECEGPAGKRECSCPIRFLARVVEEIFAISECFHAYKINFNEMLDIDNFDVLIKEKHKEIDREKKDFVERVIKRAKKHLGNYGRSNKRIDFYFNKMGALFLPLELSKKLSKIGRIPATIENTFMVSLNEILYK